MWSVVGMLVFTGILVTILWPVVEPIFGGNRLLAGAAGFWFLFGICIIGDMVAGPGHKVKNKWHAYAAFTILSVAMIYMAVPGLFDRPRSPGLVAHNTQPLMPPTAIPTVAPMPTQPPAPIVAQPATNDSAVGVAAVRVLGEVVEREQRQNEALVERSNGDNLVVIGVLACMLVVAVVILASRGRRATEPAQHIQISKPDSPEQLSDGVYVSVNGELVRLGDVPKNKQKAFPKR